MTLDLFLSVLIGYAFGNILFAELVGAVHKKSLFEYGSGNPGMANTMKVLGKTAGFLVLGGDILKTFLAVVLCQYLFKDYASLVPLYTGVGVMLGHCFPFWHHFYGGKGVAVVSSAFVLYWAPAGWCALAAGGLAVLLKLGLKKAAIIIDAVYMIWMCFRFSWITFIPALFMAVMMAWLNARPNRLKDGKPADSASDTSDPVTIAEEIKEIEAAE